MPSLKQLTVRAVRLITRNPKLERSKDTILEGIYFSISSPIGDVVFGPSVLSLAQYVCTISSGVSAGDDTLSCLVWKAYDLQSVFENCDCSKAVSEFVGGSVLFACLFFLSHFLLTRFGQIFVDSPVFSLNCRSMRSGVIGLEL